MAQKIMKSPSKLIILIFTLLAVAASTYAQSPRAKSKREIATAKNAEADKTVPVEQKKGAIRAQEQRISGAWKRPHALNDGVPRLIILYVRQTSNGRWNLFFDYYIQNERVSHDIIFPRWDQDTTVLRDGELRFSEACYNIRGTVSADGHTLNLAYTLRPHQNCPNADRHKEEVLKYTR